MRIRLAVPDELDDQERKEALNHALEAVTIANTGLFKRNRLPKIVGLIKSGAVKWKPEPPGDEHFDLATTVAARGWGDCDDLAPAYAGQLRATGVDPQARAFVRRSGPTRWHALVRRGDGTIEDPSRAAGMGHNVSGDVLGAASPIHKPMTLDPRLCIAIRGSKDNKHWLARVDVPDAEEGFAWSAIAPHMNPKSALLSAVKTAQDVVGEEMDEEDDFRLSAVHDLLMGADPYEVYEALEDIADEDVDAVRIVLDGVQSVGFLDALTKPFRSLAHVAEPLTRPITSTYDKVSPYLTAAFPGLAAVADPARAALETGDPLEVYKARLMPGARSGRDVFERNPAGGAAFGLMQKAFGNVPGAEQWFAAAKPRPAGAPAPATSQPDFNPAAMVAMLTGQGGNAPPTEVFERGTVAQPYAGGSLQFMRF